MTDVVEIATLNLTSLSTIGEEYAMATDSSGEVGLWRAARLQWRYFIALWVFPIALLLSLWLPEFEKYSSVYIYLLLIPALLAALWVSMVPLRREEIPGGHYLFWAFLAPFVIGLIAIFGLFGLALLADAIRTN